MDNIYIGIGLGLLSVIILILDNRPTPDRGRKPAAQIHVEEGHVPGEGEMFTTADSDPRRMDVSTAANLELSEKIRFLGMVPGSDEYQRYIEAHEGVRYE